MPKPENIIGKGFDKHPEHINKKGRPRKLPALDELLDKVLGELGESGISAMEAILKAQRTKAARGDTRAAELLLDRAYGKSKQVVDLSNTDGTLKPDLSKYTPEQLHQMAIDAMTIENKK